MGVLDHNAVLETVDEDFSLQAEKYVDDLTIFEPIGVGRPGLIEADGSVAYQARSSQKSLENIEEKCLQKGLKINDKKTQLISISSSGKAKAWLKTKELSLIHI